MTSPIVFYDIPSNAHARKTWSPNTQKIRYSLNLKGLPYKTVWVELPDVEALGIKLGAKPDTMAGKPWYTLPIIYDPSTDRVVADSLEIAKYLDEQYPETPNVIPPGTDALQAIFVQYHRTNIALPMFSLTVASIDNKLSPYAQRYHRHSREQWFGRLEDVMPPGPKRDEGFRALKSKFDELDKLLKHGAKDRYTIGDGVSFADLHFCANLRWFRLFITPEEWAEVATWSGGRWLKHLQVLQQWEEGVGDESEVWKPE